MDQLGGRGGRAASEVGLLAQKDGKTASGSVAGDPATIDAAADDG
jgi:hypothetical protein